MVIAMSKLYCISIIQGSMTIYNTSFEMVQVYMKMTFMFGLIVIGNVVDNVSQPKYVTIFLQITLGLYWLITGIFVNVSN